MVRHVSEIAHSHERVLIVGNTTPTLMKMIGKRFEQYDAAVQKTIALPSSYSRFHRIFFLNLIPDPDLQLPRTIRTTVILIRPQHKKFQIPHSHSHTKYILLSNQNIHDEALDQILWFSISNDSEKLLDLRDAGRSKELAVHKNQPFKSTSWRNRLLQAVVLSFMVLSFGFIIPLIPATILHLTMLDAFVKNNSAPVTFLQPSAKVLTQASSALYIPARPFYSLLSISLFPERYLHFNTFAEDFLNTSKGLAKSEQLFLQKLTQPQSKRVEIQNLIGKIDKENQILRNDIERLISNMPNNKNLNSIRQSLRNRLTVSEKIIKAVPIASSFLNDSEPKSLMVLLVNNNRVRGSGGIIDSIGIIKFDHESITSSQFYSAKQLNPPGFDLELVNPILTNYTPAEASALNDAMTSVDLFDAQDKLLRNLSSVLPNEKPDSMLLITTTALQNILSAFPDIPLDENEIVSAGNIAIKQQLYGNNPDFLPIIVQRLSETIGTVNPNSLFSAVITSFNEKQLALLSTKTSIQEELDRLYWSGKTITPKCVSSKRCINDYLLSVDQDLSSRTGTAYIQKAQTKSITFIDNNKLKSTVRVSWKNDSPLPENQGGMYKIYTQLLLPGNATITEITKNNTLVENVDTVSGQFYVIGLYLEASPQQTTELAVTYTIPARFSNNDTTTYQFITQKQLGSFTNSLTFDADLPENFSVVSTNIDAVVNKERIAYNSILNTDKLFFIELKKR